MDFKQIISVSLVLFSVIDIVGSIPVIIDLRKRNNGHIESGKATLAAGLIMVLFLFVGESVLHLFGVDIQSFAVAGSLIIFLLGLEMVLGIHLFKNDEDDKEGAAVSSIVPLAFPLIAGAGTMTTLLSLRAEFERVNILAGIVLNLIFVYTVLKSSAWIQRKIGKAGENVLRKVFGVILISIAVKLFKTHWFVG